MVKNILKVTMLIIFSIILISPAIAQEWEFIGLEGEKIQSIVVDPDNDDIIYVGSANYYNDIFGIGGIFKTIDGGANWDTLLTGWIDVLKLVMHPMDANILYAALGGSDFSQPGIVKTTNSGSTWFRAESGIYVDLETFVYDIGIDPLNPDTLYAGTGGFYGGWLYKSYDSGASWHRILYEILDTNMHSIAIDPFNTQTVYLGTSGLGRLFKTTNGGNNWNMTTIPVCGGVISLAIDDDNPLVIYAGGFHNPEFSDSGSVYRSADSCLTWTPSVIEGTIPNQIVIHPEINNMIYVSCMQGVLYSNDAATTWTLMNEGLENIHVRALAINFLGDQLYCGTTAGAYRRSNEISIEDIVTEGIGFFLLRQNYPNPFYYQTMIPYSLTKGGRVTLSIVNATGQKVKTLVNSLYHGSGDHAILWDGTDHAGQAVAAGTYFYRLQAKSEVQTRRLILLK
ncbi:MAG: hypothetical protein B6244_14770 [Candidatus Cloacimonetes bacterium 4572_55]|nr:MAG: hypothetical protein B6244_14770 [Candidatus Cloacimonetes bacterium 4572_55]